MPEPLLPAGHSGVNDTTSCQCSESFNQLQDGRFFTGEQFFNKRSAFTAGDEFQASNPQGVNFCPQNTQFFLSRRWSCMEVLGQDDLKASLSAERVHVYARMGRDQFQETRLLVQFKNAEVSD